VTLPEIPKFANLTLSVDKPDYDTFRDDIFVNDHCGSNISVALNPKSSYGRVVLTWNSDVLRDLDLHVHDSNGDGAGTYNRDNQHGGITGGAEAITFDVDDQDGPYVVYVYNFSGNPSEMCDAGAKITLYDGNHGQVKTFEIPENCEGKHRWFVGCLDSLTDLGSIHVKNQMREFWPQSTDC